jgi:hypothetical protein
MADDDWRLRIELDEDAAGGLLQRLGVLGSDAHRLVDELVKDRLVVTGEGRTVFVYAASAHRLDQAGKMIDDELAMLGMKPDSIVREHWLANEDRWDDEAAPDSVEVETVAEGYAPWEVRIPCPSHEAARELAERLEGEGYGVVRRWTFLIVGTDTRAEADELAQKVHGDVEPGGELVWEVAPGNPFAYFGGLGGTGTPI